MPCTRDVQARASGQLLHRGQIAKSREWSRSLSKKIVAAEICPCHGPGEPRDREHSTGKGDISPLYSFISLLDLEWF